MWCVHIDGFLVVAWFLLCSHFLALYIPQYSQRGAWYILDDHLYPDDAFKSSVASLSGGVIGMTLSQGLVEKCETIKNPRMLRVARFGALYCIATSVVLVWRGTWVGWDVFYGKFF